jgi:hypothetical protein
MWPFRKRQEPVQQPREDISWTISSLGMDYMSYYEKIVSELMWKGAEATARRNCRTMNGVLHIDAEDVETICKQVIRAVRTVVEEDDKIGPGPEMCAN